MRKLEFYRPMFRGQGRRMDRGLNAHTNRNKFLFNNVSVARSSHSINLLFAFSSSTNPMDHKCTIFKYFVTVENHPTDVFDINVIPPFRIF